MEIIVRAAAAAVVGSILALLLRRYMPDMSAVLTLATGLFVIWISSTVALRVAESLRMLAEKGSVASLYISPVMKCVGIGLISHLTAQVCRDAGQSSVASAVELCGTITALYISLPLIESMLAGVEKLL